MSSSLLAGRLALVTGAGSGIGRAVCKAFAREGAKIAAVDINIANVEQTIQNLPGDHYALAADVSSAESVGQLMTSVNDRFSAAPQIAVNCAGITKDGFLLQMEESQWNSVIDVNLKIVFDTEASYRVLIKECLDTCTLLTHRTDKHLGAGSGIGRAVCKAFAREGAKIAAVDINIANVEQTIQNLPGDHYALAADVSSAESVGQLMTSVNDRFSAAPQIAVNCAGITKDGFLLQMEESQWNSVIDVNLKGTFLINQAAGRAMQQSNVSNGSIVNIASIVGKVGNIGQCNYAASKAGVVGLTKTAAKELAKFGIRCNVILPGFIDTPMVESVPEKVIEVMKKMIPLGRMGTAEEIADTCVFLASENSRYITGTTIEVAGGLFM